MNHSQASFQGPRSSESWPFSFEGLPTKSTQKNPKPVLLWGALSCWNLDGNIILKHQRIQPSSPTSGQSEGSIMIFIKKILFDGGRHIGLPCRKKLPHGHDASHEELRWNTLSDQQQSKLDWWMQSGKIVTKISRRNATCVCLQETGNLWAKNATSN